MQGRDWLDLARQIVTGGTEVHWRGAAGRAYYALFLECRDAILRWGFMIPPRENVHAFVRLRFLFPANAELKNIGDVIDRLSRLRNRADYDLGSLPDFTTPVGLLRLRRPVWRAEPLLDAINADPARQAVAIASIRKAFP